MLLIKSNMGRRASLLIKSLFLLFFFCFPKNTYAHQLRTGLYGITLFSVGEAAGLLLNSSGGGVCAEFGITDNLGVSIGAHYAAVIPKDEHIISVWQSEQLIGCYYEIFFGNSGFSFKPTVEIGVVEQGANVSKDYGSLSQNTFVDFAMQLGSAFCFQNKNLFNNHLKIELSCIANIIPQTTEWLSMVGARLGFMYVFDI